LALSVSGQQAHPYGSYSQMKNQLTKLFTVTLSVVFLYTFYLSTANASRFGDQSHILDCEISQTIDVAGCGWTQPCQKGMIEVVNEYVHQVENKKEKFKLFADAKFVGTVGSLEFDFDNSDSDHVIRSTANTITAFKNNYGVDFIKFELQSSGNFHAVAGLRNRTLIHAGTCN
jgi:hypothetical protein